MKSIGASANFLALAIGLSNAAPNFVFLLAESTDGRLFRPNSPVPIPNMRQLMSNGSVTFDWTYSNAPVCCPSRASFLTGRYPHKITHEHNNISVHGVWNNYEGLPADYDTRLQYNLTTMFDILGNNGYSVNTAGKTDWTMGGHSESAYLEAWTHNIAFPYDISADGGWNQEDDVCGGNGTIGKGGSPGPSGSKYAGDWQALETSVAWLKSAASNGKPFMAYQGFNIVHPPYVTNEYWYSQVNVSAVSLPTWKPLEEMHPCALQQSMLKGCTPSDANYSYFHDVSRIRNIRHIYYSTIAEWDAMVGAYMTAVREAGVWDNTIWVIAADHGDMALEQQQFYKMVPYEGSTHVPLVIAGPAVARTQVVSQPTQLLDIFPTVLELAGLQQSIPGYIDGYSLMPFLQGAASDPSRPPWVMSQFHGDDIAMSWFMLVNGSIGGGGNGYDHAMEKGDGRGVLDGQAGALTTTPTASPLAASPIYKYISYGLGPRAAYPGWPGVAINPQLFELTSDPSELNDLWSPGSPVATALEATLRSAIDYPSVSMDVASYQLAMFSWFMANNTNWRAQMDDPTLVRWTTAWNADPKAAMAAVDAWLAAPVAIQPCRNATKWP